MERLWSGNYLKVWTANFMIFFSFMLVTPLLPLYLNEAFGASKDTIGLVLSGYSLTILLVRPFSGYMVDSFPRKMVLLICYFLFFAMFAGYLVAGTLLLFALVRTLHGAPMGATTVANSTVAIDVLHPTRRAEGIGYYGLSNNLAMAIAPSVGLYIFHAIQNYDLIFTISLISAGVGFLIDSSVKLNKREIVPNKAPVSLDRFLLVKGWSQGVSLACLSFSFGVLSTYLAIYGKEELGITTGTGLFFAILSVGLMLSRLIGARSLRKGKVVENASWGMLISLFGYLLFASVRNEFGYYGTALIIGLGNGHMYPAMQTMFINLAPHSQRGTANSTLLTAWDVGMGLGIILGGVVSEVGGYGSAFWLSAVVNAVGVAFFFAYGRLHFLRSKLR
ncbi:MAG: MFS transporter [Bacteroidaceae bacterium]|nr:MFS transporter [Bacteroidaceae bacterium]